MRVLITGGAGFVGSKVAARMAGDGHDVTLMDIARPGNRQLDFPLLLGDIRDGLGVLEVVHKADAEVIVHMASMLAWASSASPRAAVEINCIGFCNVLDAARMAGIRRVAWASSAGVFGGSDASNGRIPDDNPYTPRNVYAGTKVLDELIAARYADAYGLEVIGLRLCFMTGVNKGGGLGGRVAEELIEKPAVGQKGVVPYGDDVPSWLWIDDAARAISLAATSPSLKSRLLNIGGDDRSIREAADIVRRILPSADIEVERGRFGLEHPLDSRLAEEELGFHWEWNLERQLEEMLRQARDTRVD